MDPWRGRLADGVELGPDARGDLEDARAEGRVVQAALVKRYPSLIAKGPGEAEPNTLAPMIAGADLLHFAGHAEARGRRGWRSRLVLTRGALTVADLVTLGTPPRRAVLTGCETAAAERADLSAGMGLGQSLLLSGSEEVVATTERLDSANALAFSTALYETWDPADPSLARAFVAALSELDDAGLDWTPFVLMMRAP